ncbi:hypothetical protein HU200_001405 [Digitaria exilis]|uniref:Bifunctional inhibitor/plant lipid transfer protein/seed storage helical domain-containing protein n=1 Tax=Digitaria exilis TaxID=1010633 RepID=A0A835FYV3_9POAL|nr:hypothetical protein HU200_001405 [Digitaria exilis]
MAMAAAIMALASSPTPVSGQVVVPQGSPLAGPLTCTTSLISSFAPCLNFVINSTASPTADCCRSLGALMKASSGCACLILTGSVPLGVPVNRTMAINLPRACNNASVPLQCRNTAAGSAEAPAPGPVADAPAPSSLLAPSLAPLRKKLRTIFTDEHRGFLEINSAAPVTAPVETPVTEARAPAATVEPTATAPVSQGQTRPTVVATSAAWRERAHVASGPAVVLLLAVAGAALV